MAESQALAPVAEKQVTFYEDVLTAVLVNTADGARVYVPVKQLCEHLGVAWPAQFNRIKRDEVLSAEATSISVTVTESGQRGAVVCLPLKFIPGFLFGLSPSRVKPALKEKILRYRRECFDVLAEAFQEGRLTTETSFERLLAEDSPAAQAYRMAAAIMQMARQQMMLEAQLGEYDVRLADHGQRIEQIETTLGAPGRHVTPDQAMQISQAVKMVALELGKRSKKNEYGAVYGQLYREFAVTSYKLLPAGQFEPAMRWLTDWYKRITGATARDDVPF